MTDKTQPPPPPYVHPQTAEETGFFFPNGAPVPPTHPDHGPMDQLPRMEDGRFAAYYYCSKDELKAAGLEGAVPPRRIRHDGWTAQKIADFLETLRASASITDACRAVGMSRTSAYKLYHRKDSAHVRKAWDEALRHCTAVLATTAFDRAVNGTEEPVFHQGQMVGWRTRHDNRHLQWMLRARDPLNWAPLDDLEGWMRHRGIGKPEPVDASLDRLADAEAAWGQRLPGEPREENLLSPVEGEGKHAELASVTPDPSTGSGQA